MLKHANQYGLKFIFVRDRYYEPLLAFAGWRQAESYDNGNVTLWAKDDVPPAHPFESPALMPSSWEGLMWGILPVGCSLLALTAVLAIPERRRALAEPLEFPATTSPVFDLREAK
jgi:TRAP-type C4-dicarboxylate transport system permease small subunit